jgi:carbamoyl-phosphate synthase/aspartate carbamoyltransferase/dihydroorotase
MPGIDTRALTKKIREKGTMLGKVTVQGTDASKIQFEDPNKTHLVADVSVKVLKIKAWFFKDILRSTN